MRRFGLYAFSSLILIGAISAAADALIVSEREELEAFVEDMTGDVTQARIDHALRYADPETMSLEVVHQGRIDQYDKSNHEQLSVQARKALAPLEGTRLRLIQQSIDIDKDTARVAVRVHTAEGFANAVFQMRRHEDRWLTRRIVVSNS